MIRRISLVLVLVTMSLLSMAHGWQQVAGKGEVVRKPLTVDAFHGFVVEGSLDVIVTPASVQSVEVEAQENLIGLVTTEVRGGVWRIGTREGYSTNKPFVVHIRVPVIDVVELDGSGNVKADGSFTAGAVKLAVNGSGDIDMAFAASSVDVQVQGSGDVTLSGTSAQVSVAVAGSGDINARNLRAESVQASVSGSGDITVHATKRLKAAIAGSGDITYTGDPGTVDTSMDGSGEVRALRTSGKL
jgi:DUF4097 and DUF4098 domain-containing protein YvlB